MLFDGACPLSEIVVEVPGSLLKILSTALIIVLTAISEEYLDALVEPVEVTLALISEMATLDG